MNIIQFTEDLIIRGHDGQFRRDGKTPYHTHPFAVRANALKHFDNLTDYQTMDILNFYRYIPYQFIKQLIEIASLTHDLDEDQGHRGFTIDSIIETLAIQFNEYRFYLVSVLKPTLISVTHSDKEESYLNYVLRAKKDLIGNLVKRSDLEHNLSTLDSVKDKHKIAKYQMAHHILLS